MDFINDYKQLLVHWLHRANFAEKNTPEDRLHFPIKKESIRPY